MYFDEENSYDGAMMGFCPSATYESPHVSLVTIDKSGYLQMLLVM